MINLLAFFLMFLSFSTSYFIDIFMMLTINLPVIAISRGIYMLGYYLNYCKYLERNPDESNIYRFSRNEKLYFIGKNVAVILIGFLYIYIALFLAVYSLMCAGIYFINIGKRKKKDKVEKIGKFILNGAPIILAIVFVSMGDLLSTIPIVIGYILFINWGKKYAELSAGGLHSRYKQRIFQKMPIWLQYTMIIGIISPGIIILMIFAIYQVGAIDSGYILIVNLFFNVNNLLFLHLPIIVIARMFFLHAFYLNYLKGDKREVSSFLTVRKKVYFITINGFFILLGFLFIHLALILAVYSLLMAIKLFNNAEKVQKKSSYRFYRLIAFLLIPMSIIVAILFYFDPIGWIFLVVAGSLGIPIFILMSNKYYKTLNLSELRKNFNKKFARKTPCVIKYFTLIYVIVFPITLLLGIAVIGTPVKEHYWITAQDGTRLSTNVYYSPLVGKNPAPVILIRTPYNKDVLGMDYYAGLYLSQGYHVVFQDLRNTGASDGTVYDLMFVKSYSDGVDTINWITAQTWSNGKIGTSGASALAINTFFFAGMGPTSLKAQSLWFGMPSLYLDGIIEGALRYNLVIDWITATSPTNYRYQIDKIYDLINTQNTSSPAYLTTTLEAGVNTWSKVNVSALHVGGWYDVFLGGTLRGFKGYDDKGGINARGRQRLIVGPWTHGAMWGGLQGSILYPESSMGLGKVFQWDSELFDEAFNGIPIDYTQDRVQYYLMGDPADLSANYWKSTKDWPLAYTPEEWFFGLNNTGGNQLIKAGTGLTAQNYSYLHDPRDPCPTIGGNNLGHAGRYAPGPQNQNALLSRSDVVSFTSNVLTQPYTIEGDISARLFFKSNCNDTDFMVRLCDVYPDGRSMLIIDGAKMARLRKNMFSQDFLNSSTPNREYNMTIDLFSSAYRFNVGHKIKIIISSSNYPRYAINPNTGGLLTDHYSEGLLANNTIITGPGKSRIYLPVLS